jgi:hypothetical protein
MKDPISEVKARFADPLRQAEAGDEMALLRPEERRIVA